MANKYPGLPRYILETDYGCNSNYGWTIASTSAERAEGDREYEHWSKTSGQYRLVDGETGAILRGDDNQNP